MEDFPERLRKKLTDRETANALRYLTFNEGKIDFCSNDYLGFARNSELHKRVYSYIEKHRILDNGSSGSRLLSGNSPLFQKVETLLCEHYKAKASLLFNSGYDANLGLFGSVPQKGDLVFYDELIHASIRDGIRMSNAKAYKFAHNNLIDLEQRLQRVKEKALISEEGAIYVVTESVFSMDGDSPDLKAMIPICDKYETRLIVDEAHAVGLHGTNGAGLLQALGLQEDVFARVITFGKALGAHGAAVLGSESLIQYLINFARSFVYSTALPPHSLVTIQQAHMHMQTKEGIEQRKLLSENIAYFRSQLSSLGLDRRFLASDSAIQSCILSDNQLVKQMAQSIQERGFDVRPIMAPTVPAGRERIRFCLHSYNTKEQISDVLILLREQWKKR